MAAAVVGGVNIFGGAGTLFGALLGAVLIDVLDQSLLRVPGLSEFWRDAVLGALILVAVAVDFLLGKRLRLQVSRATAAALSGRRRRSKERRPMRDRAFSAGAGSSFLAAILVVVFLVNISLSPFYLGEQNFVNMFQLSIEKLIVVVVMTFVIINGEIDLSVASVMGFSACVLAGLARRGWSSIRVAVVIAVLAGTAAGLLQAPSSRSWVCPRSSSRSRG